MTTTLAKPVALAAVHTELRERVIDRFPTSGSATVTVEITNCDPLTWLEAQEHGSKLFWSTPDGLTEIAACGVADLQTAEKLNDLKNFQQELAEEAPFDAWYYGGLRFDKGGRAPTEPWVAYRGISLIRPRVVLVRKGDKTTITCHLMASDSKEEVLEQVEQLSFPTLKIADERVPDFTQLQLTPEQPEWEERVQKILDRIEKGEISKQVLARKVDLRLTRTLSPFQLLRKMREKAPRCFSFLISPEPGNAFIGSTPELLYTRQDDEVRCEAVAGTRPAGAGEAEQEQYGRELISCTKERHEHGIVSEHIQDVLDDLCTEVSADVEPSVLRRGDWQHLYKQFEATLQPGVSDLRILDALSPTPAVAGASPEEVVELEGFDRGWYAGPIGWVSPGAAEFAVAIRSALVQENHVTFYAGAGIVEGSDPAQEWQETDTKLGTFLRIFDV